MGRRLRLPRPAHACRVHRAHRRPRLCAPRHHLRHPPHRPRQGRREARASLRRPSSCATPAISGPRVCCRRSPAPCRPGVPSSPCRARTCSARRPRPGPRGRSAPGPPRIGRSRSPTTGARSAELVYEAVPAGAGPAVGRATLRPLRGDGGLPASTCRERSRTRHRWCSPAPWRRCPTQCRRTARCCRRSVVTKGLLSDAQLESVVLAGQAHERHLSAEYRIGAGWETVQRVDADGDDGDDEAALASEDDSAIRRRRRAAVRSGALPARLDAGRRHRLRQGPAGRRHRPRPVVEGPEARPLALAVRQVA